MAINLTELFTRLGNGFYSQEILNTIAATGSAAFRTAAATALAGLSSGLQAIVLETVEADVPQPSRDLTAALKEVIKQMDAGSETVDASTAAVTVTADATNLGDGVVVASAKRADGRNAEYAIAETVRAEVTNASSPATATLSCKGEASQATKLAYDWPLGSGTTTSVRAISAASSLLDNGDFDDDSNVAHVPDGWIVGVGTLGTTLKQSVYEIQRIAITGSPSAGVYYVNLTNTSSQVQRTDPIAYDATGDTLQSALRALTGFELVEVTTTGTGPNYTHDIEFIGVGGNLTELTVTNSTTGGTFTVSTPTSGSANIYSGRSIELDSDGSQLTAIYSEVSLAALTQYAFNLWIKADVVPAAGVITISLVDGIAGTILNDAEGTANSFTITCSGLSTSFAARNGVFRTPRVLPSTVYLRIAITTAISGGTSVFLDHAALGAMTQLYAGGPSVAAFSGKVALQAKTADLAGDGFAIAVTNDRAGEFQEWFERNFAMAAKGLILPSNAAGTETIADTLVA